MKAFLTSAVLVLSLLAASAAGTSSQFVGWAQFGFDAGHSGANPFERAIARRNVATLRPAWSAQLGASVQLTPAVANGVVYVGAGGLFALDAATGKTLWRASGAGNSPAVGNGIVYSGRAAFDSATGAPRWSWSFLSPVGPGTPTLAAGRLYVSGARGTIALAALDASSGRPLWLRPHLDCFYICSPAVANGLLYVNAGPSKSVPSATLEALDARTGATRWARKVGMPNTGPPVVAGGRVFVPAATCRVIPCKRHHYLAAFAARTGARLWQAPIGRSGMFPAVMPAVAGGVVYHAAYDGYLYALRATSGKRLWRVRIGGPAAPGITVANGLVYTSVGNWLRALDGRNGRVLWRWTLEREAAFAPVVVDGSVYVGSTDGRLYSFRPRG